MPTRFTTDLLSSRKLQQGFRVPASLVSILVIGLQPRERERGSILPVRSGTGTCTSATCTNNTLLVVRFESRHWKKKLQTRMSFFFSYVIQKYKTQSGSKIIEEQNNTRVYYIKSSTSTCI
jgi:hypothetical protein